MVFAIKPNFAISLDKLIFFAIICSKVGDQCPLNPGGTPSPANTLVLIAASNVLSQCCKGTRNTIFTLKS